MDALQPLRTACRTWSRLRGDVIALCRLARRLNRRADRALREMRSPKVAVCLEFRDVRLVWQKYRSGLLNRYTVINRIVGSNPIPSAKSRA
jgi:hypothetical protein